VLDRVLNLLTSDLDPRVNPDLELRAAGLKALYLSRLGRHDEAVAACDPVLARYQDAPPPDVDKTLAALMRTKASSLAETGRPADAIVMLEQVSDRFQEDMLEQSFIASMLVQKMVLLRQTNRPADALSTCREIISRFGDNPPRGTPWVVLDALHEIPFALAVLGRHDEALSACDEVVDKFAREDDLTARHAVSSILKYKADLLLKRGSTRKALKTLDAVLAYTADSTAPELDGLANSARDLRRTIVVRRNDARRVRIAMLTPPATAAMLTWLSLRTARSLIRKIRRP
jgi:tetratricopeptide (TPR) repeat protein